MVGTMVVGVSVVGTMVGVSVVGTMVDGHIAVEVHTYAPWDWFAQKGKWDEIGRAHV